MDVNRWKLFCLALRLVHEFKDSELRSIIVLSQSSNLKDNSNNNNNNIY